MSERARIDKATAATMSELAPGLPRQIGPASDASGHDIIELQLRPTSHLGQTARDTLYTLWDHNIRPLAKGTEFDVPEADKREELFDATTRFLLLLRKRSAAAVSVDEANTSPHLGPENNTAAAGTDEQAKPKKKKRKKVDKLDFGPDELVGYCSFRFDVEEDAEVIYCYELQLAISGQRRGFGRILIAEMERIGRERGMEKAMLTCISANVPAKAFYAKMGYDLDEYDLTRITSPTKASKWATTSTKVGYYILTKHLQTPI